MMATSIRRPENLEIARAYVAAGVSIIPLRCDGSKKTSLDTWNPYRERFATDGHLVAWFGHKRRGIGIVCGILSHGLEVLDFDEEADLTFQAWHRSLPPKISTRLCVVETAGFGYHVLYRSTEVCGNQKIAMSEDGKGTLIESRGEGGYVCAVGSAEEVHESKRPYVQVLGPPLPEVPNFTVEERKALWVAAAALDRRDPEQVHRERVMAKARSLRSASAEPPDPSTPWGDFDLRGSWSEVLEPFGWTTGDGITWTRPGKSGGTTARVNLNGQGVEILTVFSPNAAPLECDSYGKYRAYKILAHKGDKAAAIRALSRRGYGRSGR